MSIYNLTSRTWLEYTRSMRVPDGLPRLRGPDTSLARKQRKERARMLTRLAEEKRRAAR